MQIQIMRCTAEKNRINKSAYITNVFSIEGNIIENCDIQNPVITIEKTTQPLKSGYNYMYIPEFKRYYYITWVNVTATMWEIRGSIDVLYTYMGDILNNKAIIDKSEDVSKSNLYINDGSFVMDARKYNQVLEFPSGFSSSGYNILICAGG